MLSLLRKTTARAWDTTAQDRLILGYSENEEDPVLSINIEELRDYVFNAPWHRLAQACSSTVAPVCTAVRDTVHNDIDSLARLLVDLEVSSLTATEPSSADIVSALDASHPASIPPSLHPAISTDEYVDCPDDLNAALGHHGTLPGLNSTSHGLPTIVVTPCPSQARDRSGWVPFQDASFGNRLVVPSYPVVNDVFPPMVAKSSPIVERWKFADGHWWALLPSLDEQMQRGMFSRPIHCRRRKSYPDGRSKFHLPLRSRSPAPSRRATNST